MTLHSLHLHVTSLPQNSRPDFPPHSCAVNAIRRGSVREKCYRSALDTTPCSQHLWFLFGVFCWKTKYSFLFLRDHEDEARLDFKVLGLLAVNAGHILWHKDILPMRLLSPVEVHPFDFPPSQVGVEGFIQQSHAILWTAVSSPAGDLGKEAMAFFRCLVAILYQK